MSSSTLSNNLRANWRWLASPARCPGILSRTGGLTPWLAALVLLATHLAAAQEALRTALDGDAAAQARHNQLESQPYTVKSGDFKLLVVPSLSLEWNDNVNISKTNAQQAFILRPAMQLNASYPVTENNLLSLNVGVGYDQYIEHNSYSTWFLQSGTELSFDIYVKDFWFNLHDRAQYVQDTSQQPALSGTATYATINNTAGFSVTWNLNQGTLSTGYDHRNVISTSQQFNSQDSAAEMVFVRGGLQAYPGVTTGLEITGSHTTYAQDVLNNNNAYSAGPYADWELGKYFHIQPRGGYTIIQFQQTSQSIQTSDLKSWYADLNITHQATDAISYGLDAGREVQAGIQSDVIEDWYVRPSLRWNVNQNLNLHTSFSYEHGNQGVGNVTGNLTETFDWIGTEVGVSYPLLKKLSLGLNCRLTLRSSNIATDAYTQNLVSLALTYQAQ
jgi:hypothetical protein